MNKLTKNGLRIAFVLVALGFVFWLAGFFGADNSEDYKTMAIYFFVSSVLFASPHMIIKHQKDVKKTRLETSADFAVSGFYTAALLFVLYNAIPYFDSGASSTNLQLIGQVSLVVSFVWTLCLHLWSTLASLFSLLKAVEN